MLNPLISCFKDEFDRFFDLLKKQISIWPDEIWTAKLGGYPVWQQMFHTVACIESFALPEGQPSKHKYSRPVVMLAEASDNPMSKEDLLELAEVMHKLAHDFINSMTLEKLAEQHVPLSKVFGKVVTNQHALIGPIRHTCYHIGCCDAILRERGLPGVY